MQSKNRSVLLLFTITRLAIFVLNAYIQYLGTIAELPRFGFVVDFLNQDCKKDLCNLADDILSQVSDSDCSSTKQFQALQDAAAKLSL